MLAKFFPGACTRDVNA